MLDSNRPNQNCGFTKEVVSYLYDEMQGNEKTKFENHLEGCRSCPEEIAAFASVSTAVQNWRDDQFSNLATPLIEIPYGDSGLTVESTTEAHDAWYERLRRIFDFSPVLLKTATVFGTLAVVLGLGWFMMSGLSDGQDVVVKKRGESSSKVLQENPETIQYKQIEISETNDSEVVLPKDAEPIKVRNTPRKLSSRNVKVNKNKSKKGTRVKKKEKPVVYEEVPRLTEEVAIEDTDELRLTDIFSEIGTDD